jgi:hypothetical protein
VNHAKFKLSFWHPFGPHAEESMSEIIDRKRAEIRANGWTLWSFAHRPMLADWQRELDGAAQDGVFAFCSEGKGAVDPVREGSLSTAINCQRYRFVDNGTKWFPMPDGVRVPHPFQPGREKLASAFVVQQIVCPVEPSQRPAVEWFSPNKGPWCNTQIPTRGVYLIRQGGTVAMRSVSAVLELRPPYLTVCSADED